MTDILENLALGIAANALTSVLVGIKNQVGGLLVDRAFLEELRRRRASIEPILKEATQNLSDSIDWRGSANVEEVGLFLLSPEVEAILRQIYSMKLVVGTNMGSITLVRQEFTSLLTLHLELTGEALEHTSEFLFTSLISACNLILDEAIDGGKLAAHEAQSAFRHQILLDELASVQKNVDFLSASRKVNLEQVLLFEKDYRMLVGQRHAHITPPNFDTVRKVPIDDLYVSANFIKGPGEKKSRRRSSLTRLSLLSTAYRSVILGNPGGGKSTFAYKLVHDLAMDYSHRLFAGRLVTPILVTLRDYGTEKKTRGCSILQFIELTANSMYQLLPPIGAFEYLLLNGRVIVVFDGLDELLDTSYRQAITGDIESFCTLYTAVPIIVTSREVGYEQSPLNEKMFEVFHLAPFSDSQVQEYVKKWFALETDLLLPNNKPK